MARPTRCRRIERLPEYRSFSPDDVHAAESVRMTVDEFEALRLLDDEGLTQEGCAERMNVARTTVTAIYDSARRKVADALVHGKRLLITGGCCAFEPVELTQTIMEKGNNSMRIAVRGSGRLSAGGPGGRTDLRRHRHGGPDGPLGRRHPALRRGPGFRRRGGQSSGRRESNL